MTLPPPAAPRDDLAALAGPPADRRPAGGPASPRGRGGLNRRAFLGAVVRAGAGVGLALAAGPLAAGPLVAAEPTIEGLPTRILGRTGQRVTILGLGTAPVGEGPIDTPEAVRIFGEVLDRGVNYVDTARIYGNAEEALGQLLPKRRDRLFLVTKVWTDSAAGAEKAFSESLRQLKVDHVDLVHIHNIGDKDLAKVRAADGVLAYLLKQKEAGKLRFIGLSGHCRPGRFVEMLATDQIDVVMPVINYADRHTYACETTVLPECRKRNVAVVAMKVYAGIKGGFPNHKKGHVGCATREDLLPQAMAYVLDLPGVCVANVGPYTLEQAVRNVEIAKAYRPLTDAQRDALLAHGKQLAAELGPRYGPVA